MNSSPETSAIQHDAADPARFCTDGHRDPPFHRAGHLHPARLQRRGEARAAGVHPRATPRRYHASISCRMELRDFTQLRPTEPRGSGAGLPSETLKFLSPTLFQRTACRIVACSMHARNSPTSKDLPRISEMID